MCVDVLANYYLLFFSLRVMLLLASQLINVLWQLVEHCSLAAPFDLVCPIEPLVNLFKHFMQQTTVLIDQDHIEVSKLVFCS